MPAATNPLALSIWKKLSTPEYQIISVKDLIDMDRREQLITNAEFQRDNIWSPKDDAAFIGSAMAGAPTGQIVLVSNGHGRWIVLDGKQRITALVSFIEGRTAVSDEEGVRWAWKQRSRCKALTAQMRTEFESIQITLVKYSEMLDKQQRQLFQALQLGQKLNSAQKLHGALRTPRKRLCESICEFYDTAYTESFGPRKSNPTFELIAIRAAHMVISGSRGFTTPQKLLHWVSSEDNVSTQDEDRLWESLALTFSALSMPRAHLIGERQGHYALAPVEFNIVVVFAEAMFSAGRHVHDEPSRMARGIKKLRQHLRHQFPGVLKSNNSVFGCGLSFVKSWMRTHPARDDEIDVKKADPLTEESALSTAQQANSNEARSMSKKKYYANPADIIDLTLDCTHTDLS